MAVCTWGFGKYGQLGTGQASSCEIPQVMKIPRNLMPLHVSCGAHFTTVCAKPSRGGLRRLYACGWGKYGRLGIGSEEDQLTATEVALDPSVDVVKVSSGHWHACCISSDGCLFSWGYNKSHGVLGLGEASPTSFEVVPVRIPLPSGGVKFSTVACGHNYTYAVTVEGRCWSWGTGAHGVLGHGDTKDCSQPTPVEAVSDISIEHVSCGYSHAALVDSAGVLYTVGNGEDEALGHGKADKSDKMVPTKVQALLSMGVNITSGSCSQGEHHGHTLACTASGEVYSWGDGYKGKLGHGDQASCDLPTRIDPSGFLGQVVTQVSCGGIHSAAVTQEGCVFTWGCGSDGRLGHPEAKGHRYLFRSDTPRKVEGLPANMKAVAISCSYYHSAVLCSVVN